MKHFRCIFILLCLLNLTDFIKAQTEFSNFLNLKIDGGLSHTDVNCIIQDYEGFIWIGTTNGLNRYDGIGVTVYKNNNNDSTTLNGNHILSLFDDEQKYSDKEKKEMAKNIHLSTKKIFNLLENLLIWSRSQINRINYSPSSYNITFQISMVISLMKELSTAKKIKVIFCEDKEIFVFADMYMIETVFRNLITNAIKFSEENDEIKIEVVEEKDFIICSVSDQGIGMTKEQIDNLFHIDKVTSTVGTNGEKGSGLGLSLCIDFIEKNGGKIWVESKPGIGSTFYFSVPKK